MIRRLSPFIASILMAACVTITALAYASPVDPTWIAGVYDDADYDEVVNLLTETSGVGDGGFHTTAQSLTAIAGSAEGASMPVQSATLLCMQPRSPPPTARVSLELLDSTLLRFWSSGSWPSYPRRLLSPSAIEVSAA